MCSAYDNANEKEGLLASILDQCIDAGALYAEIETKYNHDSLVQDGLPDRVGNNTYKLNTRSVGLLYSVYGR